jgi:hypothetical protein
VRKSQPRDSDESYGTEGENRRTGRATEKRREKKVRREKIFGKMRGKERKKTLYRPVKIN